MFGSLEIDFEFRIETEKMLGNCISIEFIIVSIQCFELYKMKKKIELNILADMCVLSYCPFLVASAEQTIRLWFQFAIGMHAFVGRLNCFGLIEWETQ